MDAAEEPVNVLGLALREGVNPLTSVVRPDRRVAVVGEREGLAQNTAFDFAVA